MSTPESKLIVERRNRYLREASAKTHPPLNLNALLLGDNERNLRSIQVSYTGKPFIHGGHKVRFNCNHSTLENLKLGLKLGFSTNTYGHYLYTRGYVFVFDIADESSVKDIEAYIEYLKKYYGDEWNKKAAILVGIGSPSGREVSAKEAQQLATKHKMSYQELPAAYTDSDAVNQLFLDLLIDFNSKNQQEIPTRSCNEADPLLLQHADTVEFSALYKIMADAMRQYAITVNNRWTLRGLLKRQNEDRDTHAKDFIKIFRESCSSADFIKQALDLVKKINEEHNSHFCGKTGITHSKLARTINTTLRLMAQENDFLKKIYEGEVKARAAIPAVAAMVATPVEPEPLRSYVV